MSWWVFGVIVVGPIPGVKRANHKTAIMALRSAHDAPKCFAVVPLSPCLLATDVCLVHLDQPGEFVAARPDHGAAELVEPRPRGLVFTPSMRLTVTALAPYLWPVISHAAMNHSLSGFRVPSKIVPAMIEYRTGLSAGSSAAAGCLWSFRG